MRLQQKARLLSDLKQFCSNESAESLTLFAQELNSVYLSSGISVAKALLNALNTSASLPPLMNAEISSQFELSQQKENQTPTTQKENQAIKAQNPVQTENKIKVTKSAPTISPKQEDESAQISLSKIDAEIQAQTEAVQNDSSSSESLSKALALLDKTWKDIPSGVFMMGSDAGNDSEKPEHKVNLKAFKMSAFLITNKIYKFFITDKPSWRKDKILSDLHDGNYLSEWSGDDYPEGKDEHPVSNIPFAAASAFAAWLGARLPTEAEWEYAARGGLSAKKFPSGDQMNDKLANFAKQYKGTTPVGKFEANAYGLFDRAGNLFEWCSDWYGPYSAKEEDNPVGKSEGDYKVMRGGSWISSANALRVSFRIDESPESAGFVGIRLVK